MKKKGRQAKPSLTKTQISVLIGFVIVDVVVIVALGSYVWLETKNEDAAFKEQQVEQLVISIDELPVARPNESVRKVDKKEVVDHDLGAVLTCVTKEHNVTKNFEEIVVLNPNTETLWPGAIIQGETVKSGVLAGVNLPRAPGTIIVQGLGLNKSSAYIADPHQASVQAAVETLLPKKSIEPEARISYVMEETYSLDHAMLQLGLSVNLLPSAVRAGVSFDSTRGNHHIVIKFYQPYYTVVFESPESPASFFEDVNLEQASLYIGPNNPPVYVSSITYGRMLIAIASSEVKAQRLKAALDYAYFGKLGFDAYSQAELEHTLSETKMQIVAIGGSSQHALKIITANELKEYFEEGGKVSKSSRGVPISYRLNYLRNNRAVRLGYAAGYKVVDCEQDPFPPTDFRVTLDKLCVYETGEGLLGGKADVYLDFAVVDHEGIQHSITNVPKNSAIKQPSSATCANPLYFNDSKVVRLPSRNGICFTIEGEFHDNDRLGADTLVGRVHQQICYRDGEWSSAVNTTADYLRGGSAEWEVYYTVKKLSE